MQTIGGRFRAAALISASALALLFAAGARAQNWDYSHQSNDNPWPYAKTGTSPVLVVVGDVACQPDRDDVQGAEAAKETCDTPKSPYTSTAPGPYSLWQSQAAVAAQIEAWKPDAVALVGDLQYQVGQYQDFENSYDLTFGAFKKITKPAPGNHEFYNEHGATGVAGYGYFSYFNGVQQITTSGSTVGSSLPAGTPLMATINGVPELITPTTTTLGTVTIPAGTPVMATVAGIPDTDGTFTQPIPNSDGQAGHFVQSGASEYSPAPTAMYADGPSAGTAAPVGVGEGWYSYNVGSWHLISLNIECETQPGGCSDSTGTWFAQETEWLKNDLAANHSQCTAAYWHQPTYSAADSLSEEGITAGTWWQMLYDAGADLVLNGHDHLYARYAPVKPYFDATKTSVAGVTGTWLGTSDPKKGIVEFIVGTGGETLDAVVSTPSSSTDYDGTFNHQFLKAYTGNFWGSMALTLNQDSYDWNYQSALPFPGSFAPSIPAGTSAAYSDMGSANCHGGPYGDNGQGNDYGQDK